MIDSELPGARFRGNALVGEEGVRKAPKSGVATATSTLEATCAPTSTPFSRQFTCWWTTSCLSGRARGLRPGSQTPIWSRSRSPRCSWGSPTTASSWRSPATASRTCFPTCPSSPATTSGSAGYGYCRSHSRYFWGFRLYLLCARDGTPIGFELAPANAPEREVAKELLERVPLAGYAVVADKGFAGQDFERFVAEPGATFLRPDRKNEPRRHGSLGHIRQWIESVFWTCKGQLGLERHGARTLPGLCARIGLRLLALSAGLWHNWQIGDPGRHLAAYTH